jgi:AcrR family transcriptional regulator
MSSPNGVAVPAPAREKAAFRKLKPGPGLSRQAVAADQCLRLRVALAALSTESGYEAVTVRALIRRASVSTSTFYKHFGSVEECFAAIVGMTIRSLVGQVRDRRDHGGDTLGGLRATVHYLMETMAREPEIARAVFVETFAAGPRVRGEMDAALGEFEELLAEALELAPRPAVGTRHLAVGLVAGVVRIVRKTTLTGRADELPELADELTDWMLAVAHEEVVGFRAPRSRSAPVAGTSRSPRLAAPPSREAVADSSRRAVMATARLAAENGLAGLTSARIRKDAGLSRSEFDRHFRGVEDCFLDAVESISELAGNAAELAAAGTESWERRIYKTMMALCTLAAADRALSRLVLLDITAPGRTGLLRREELISRCVAHIRAGAPADKRPSELVVDASIGAIWRIAETEVAAGRTAQLPLVAPVFVYMLLASRRPQVPEPTVESRI